MNCLNCGSENHPGAKFCENCGSQMPQNSTSATTGKFCANCGHPLLPENKFCENCGTAVGGGPVQAAAPPPRRKGLRGCIWPFIGIITGLMFVCGLLFWATIFRIPVSQRSSSNTIVVRTVRSLRILQSNLNQPQEVVKFADQFQTGEQKGPELKTVIDEVDDTPTTVQVETVQSCQPQVELVGPEVSTIQIWNLQSAFGRGPTIYDFENVGESLSKSKFEYFAEWSFLDSNSARTSSHVYSCSIDNEHLICFGPEPGSYDTALMNIFSENPECSDALARYPFVGGDPFPADNDALACYSPEDIRQSDFERTSYVDLDGFELLPDSLYWKFYLNDVNTFYQGIDDPYNSPLPLSLNSEVFDPELNQWRSFQSDCWRYSTWIVFCMGWDIDEFPSYRWSLSSKPVEQCTQALASGMGGSVVAEEPEQSQSCVPEIIQSNLSYFVPKMQGRDPGWTPSFDNTFAVHLPSLDDLDNSSLELYVTYEVFNADGVGIDSGNKYECETAVQFGMPCDGPDVEDDQTVNMKVYYANDGCNELIAQEQWAGVQVAQPPPQPPAVDRCSLFDDVDMSIVYLDWISGAPLQFYFKMPGGVPGLEKKITGDTGDWEYEAKIGDYTSSNCDIIQGYNERLYCAVSLPSGYSNAMRPMTLSVNGCDVPVYENQTAFLPGIEGSSGGSTAGDGTDSGGSGGGVCGAEPADSGSPQWSDWCSCRWDNGLSC